MSNKNDQTGTDPPVEPSSIPVAASSANYAQPELSAEAAPAAPQPAQPTELARATLTTTAGPTPPAPAPAPSPSSPAPAAESASESALSEKAVRSEVVTDAAAGSSPPSGARAQKTSDPADDPEEDKSRAQGGDSDRYDPRRAIAAFALHALMNSERIRQEMRKQKRRQPGGPTFPPFPLLRARAYWTVSVGRGRELRPMLEAYPLGEVISVTSTVSFKVTQCMQGGIWQALRSGEKIAYDVVNGITPVSRCASEAEWRKKMKAKFPAPLSKRVARSSGFGMHITGMMGTGFRTPYGSLVIALETTCPDAFGNSEEADELSRTLMREYLSCRVMSQVDFWTWFSEYVRKNTIPVGLTTIFAVVSTLLTRVPSFAEALSVQVSLGATTASRGSMIAACHSLKTALFAPAADSSLLPVVRILPDRQELGRSVEAQCLTMVSGHGPFGTFFFLLQLLFLALFYFLLLPEQKQTAEALPHDVEGLKSQGLVKAFIGDLHNAVMCWMGVYVALAVRTAFVPNPVAGSVLWAASSLANLASSAFLMKAYFRLTRSVGLDDGERPKNVSFAEFFIGLAVVLVTALSAYTLMNSTSRAAELDVRGFETGVSAVVGGYAAVSLGLIAGRLNSPTIGTPGVLIAMLYIYVAVQPLYIFIFDYRYVTALSLLTLFLKAVFFFVLQWAVVSNALHRYLLFRSGLELSAPRRTLSEAWAKTAAVNGPPSKSRSGLD